MPTGKTWLIKQWNVYNAGAASSIPTLGLLEGLLYGNFDQLTAVAPGAANSRLGMSFVCPGGTSIYFVVSAGSTLHVHVSGAQLG